MPCDDAWPATDVALFRRWIDGGWRASARAGRTSVGRDTTIMTPVRACVVDIEELSDGCRQRYASAYASAKTLAPPTCNPCGNTWGPAAANHYTCP